MPHPGMFIIPFGCVVCQKQTVHGKSVDIFMDKTEIENLHDAFGRTPYGMRTLADLILATKDDSTAGNLPGKCSVLAYDSVDLINSPYQAFRLYRQATPDVDPDPISSGTADNWIVADDNYWYYLLRKSDIDDDRHSDRHEHRRRRPAEE